MVAAVKRAEGRMPTRRPPGAGRKPAVPSARTVKTGGRPPEARWTATRPVAGPGSSVPKTAVR
ncbi:hypothetical protein GCM10010236_59040 [Streptomyces eurythermus]|nr:hypothetical protein GCM10010236_59040 [Streptomyces eurythermus]